MKNLSLRLLITLAMAVFAGLHASVGHAYDSRDAKEARATIASLERTWNEHDMEAFAKLFTEDADFVNIEGTRWRGRAAIKDALTSMHTTIFKQSHFTIEETTLKQLDQDVIVARSTWRLEGQTRTKGVAVPPRTGILTNVLVRSGPSWKIVVTQNTDIVR